MPKATKDTEKDELNKKKSTTKKVATNTKKKATKSTTSSKSTASKAKVSTPKASSKTATSKTKKETSSVDKKNVKEETKKSTTKKATTSKKEADTKAKKSTTTKKASTNKTSKTATTKKSTTTSKKKTSTSTSKKTTSKAKKLESNIVAEYYDLPYRYNETVVKILYQTPTILFVYWDISDYDRENFRKQYGENFFNNTRPILRIFNLTKHYSFEVDINDFANSWYINVNDANCEYKVELARRTIKFEENLNTDYIYVSSSNDIEFPNDRILLDELPDKIKFKNVKTNEITTKDIGTMHLIGINKVYSAHDFYKKFYKDEILNEITNTSSSSWN